MIRRLTLCHLWLPSYVPRPISGFTPISEIIVNSVYIIYSVQVFVTYVFGTRNRLQASDYIPKIENKPNLKLCCMPKFSYYRICTKILGSFSSFLVIFPQIPGFPGQIISQFPGFPGFLLGKWTIINANLVFSTTKKLYFFSDH